MTEQNSSQNDKVLKVLTTSFTIDADQFYSEEAELLDSLPLQDGSDGK